MASRQAFTVSGPDVDRSYSGGGVALSAAITLASRAHSDVTLYVREPNGDPFGRVERHGGEILIYAKETRT